MILALLAALLLQEKEKVDLPGSKLSFEMVRLPGDGKLQPFSIATREVTWAEFTVFRNTKDPKGPDAVTRPTVADNYFGQVGIGPEFLKPEKPLINIRWHSAVAYCEWLSKMTGRYFRLPTESEWEHAARAGAEAPQALAEFAWYQENSAGGTHTAGERKANAFGLYDMLGNVWEYCLEPATLPAYGPVLRGGCWKSPVEELRYGHRQTIPWSWLAADTNGPQSVWWLGATVASPGFRVVCAADAADGEERRVAASNVEVKIHSGKERDERFGESTVSNCRIEGEIRNGGSRSLDELELIVFYLDPEGKPHLKDVGNKPGRATFGKAWPVLKNSFHEGGHRAPLKPGETRKFELDIPSTWDAEWEVDAKKFGGRVTNVRLGR